MQFGTYIISKFDSVLIHGYRDNTSWIIWIKVLLKLSKNLLIVEVYFNIYFNRVIMDIINFYLQK